MLSTGMSLVISKYLKQVGRLRKIFQQHIMPSFLEIEMAAQSCLISPNPGKYFPIYHMNTIFQIQVGLGLPNKKITTLMFSV